MANEMDEGVGGPLVAHPETCLAPGVEVVRSEGEVVFLSRGGRTIYGGPFVTEAVDRLIPRLDGEESVVQISSALSRPVAEVSDVLSKLKQAGLLLSSGTGTRAVVTRTSVGVVAATALHRPIRSGLVAAGCGLAWMTAPEWTVAVENVDLVAVVASEAARGEVMARWFGRGQATLDMKMAPEHFTAQYNPHGAPFDDGLNELTNVLADHRPSTEAAEESWSIEWCQFAIMAIVDFAGASPPPEKPVRWGYDTRHLAV